MELCQQVVVFTWNAIINFWWYKIINPEQIQPVPPIRLPACFSSVYTLYLVCVYGPSMEVWCQYQFTYENWSWIWWGIESKHQICHIGADALVSDRVSGINIQIYRSKIKRKKSTSKNEVLFKPFHESAIVYENALV